MSISELWDPIVQFAAVNPIITAVTVVVGAAFPIAAEVANFRAKRRAARGGPQ